MKEEVSVVPEQRESSSLCEGRRPEWQMSLWQMAHRANEGSANDSQRARSSFWLLAQARVGVRQVTRYIQVVQLLYTQIRSMRLSISLRLTKMLNKVLQMRKSNEKANSTTGKTKPLFKFQQVVYRENR